MNAIGAALTAVFTASLGFVAWIFVQQSAEAQKQRAAEVQDVIRMLGEAQERTSTAIGRAVSGVVQSMQPPVVATPNDELPAGRSMPTTGNRQPDTLADYSDPTDAYIAPNAWDRLDAAFFDGNGGDGDGGPFGVEGLKSARPPIEGAS